MLFFRWTMIYVLGPSFMSIDNSQKSFERVDVFLTLLIIVLDVVLLLIILFLSLPLIPATDIVFLVVGFHSRRQLLLLWSIIIFSVLVIFSQVTYMVIWAVEGSTWSIPGSWWAELVGFMMWDWFHFHLLTDSSFCRHTNLLFLGCPFAEFNPGNLLV